MNRRSIATARRRKSQWARKVHRPRPATAHPMLPASRVQRGGHLASSRPSAAPGSPAGDSPPFTARAREALGVAIRLAKRYKLVLQIGVLALIVALLVTSVARSWSQLRGYSWHVQWGLLLAGFALLVAQELSFALIWRAILGRLGSRLDVVAAERIYLGAEFVRYIPGNVWHVITRVLWAERRGVPKAVGLASMVIELATKIASAALVFAATLLLWPDPHALAGTLPPGAARGLLLGIGIVGVPLLLAGLHPKLLGAALNAALRRLRREPVRISLTYPDLLLIAGWWTLSWLVAGAGFYLLVQAIAPPAMSLGGLLLATGIYALGWDVGFLSFVTPSGLGFREVAIALALPLAGLVPAVGAGPALATVIAVLARLLSTGAEVTCITAAHLIPGGVSSQDGGAVEQPGR